MRSLVFTTSIMFWMAATASAQRPADSLISDVKRAIVQQTNDFRKENELPATKPNKQLSECASEFAKFMAETGKYGHHADGRTPAQRAKAAGYDYCVVRENIAYRMNTGQVTADSLTEVFVQGWIDSPPHRENMLADLVTETGVTVATTDGETYYAVQIFGRPRSAAIKLTVRNESGEPRVLVLEANDSLDEVEMQPRSLVKMTRCFPATLRLKNSEDELKLSESAELTITNDGIQR